MLEVRYLIRFLIMAQPFFWMWLYDRDFDLSAFRNPFYFFGGSFCITALIETRFPNPVLSFEYYTPWLLFLYSFFVLTVTYSLEEKWGFRRGVSMAFLIVYLNSYVWEFVLHYITIRTYGLSPNDLLQMLHLIPLFWMVKKFRFVIERKTMITGIRRLLIFEGLIALVVGEFIMKGRLPSGILPFSTMLKGALFNFNRLVSLLFVTLPFMFFAVDKNYKGTVYIVRSGVANAAKHEESVDRSLS